MNRRACALILLGESLTFGAILSSGLTPSWGSAVLTSSSALLASAAQYSFTFPDGSHASTGVVDNDTVVLRGAGLQPGAAVEVRQKGQVLAVGAVALDGTVTISMCTLPDPGPTETAAAPNGALRFVLRLVVYVAGNAAYMEELPAAGETGSCNPRERPASPVEATPRFTG